MQFSLNYVWIEAARLPLPRADEVCMSTIPAGLLNNIVAAAQMYPELQVSLWVDVYGVGNHPERILNGLNSQAAMPNIKIRALDEIPVYRVDPLFEKVHEDFEDPYDAIWQQLDVARLYVLRHQLLNDETKGVIYMDNDLSVPEMNNGKFSEIMCDHDICFGRFCKDTSSKDGVFENQFFAFGQDFGKRYLMSHLIPYTQDAVRRGLNGWDAMWKIVSDYDLFETLGIEDLDEIMINVYPIPNHLEIKRSYQKPNRVSAQSVPQQP